MRLLITTQAVDRNDGNLGFFHAWIAEFSRHCESVTVVCLRKGEYSLPENVAVYSLGKPSIAQAMEGTGVRRLLSRIKYSYMFLRYIVALRNRYDAVFVHMNPEYVILGGLLWRLWGKRIALWYTHKRVNLRLRLATLLAHVALTASPESFRLPTGKLRVMGHGIDTQFFSPGVGARSDAVLSVGRLSQSKRHDLVIRAARFFPNNVRIAGEGPERQRLEGLAGGLGLSERVQFLGALTHAALRDEYRKARVLVHASETGSLDKVVLEALACGLPVISTSALMGLPITQVSPEPQALAQAIRTRAPADEAALAAFVRSRHSLFELIPRILEILK